MRRTAILLLLLFLVAAGSEADTIRLKNGRVIRGQVVHYGNGEFHILVEPAGTRRSAGERMIVLVDSVESIEFASAGPAPGSPEGKVIVLTPEKEVVATGVQLQQGNRMRISASGEIQLADGRKSGPAGLDAQEALLPFPGERLGVLVALVGSPQSPTYHVIGEEAEFEARTSGELFLQINARSLSSARGSYTARLHTAQPGPAPSPGGPPPGAPRQLRYQITVPADTAWTDTGIDLLEGDTIRFAAQGKVYYTSTRTCGPAGSERTWRDLLRALPVNDAGRGALIGLVGESGVATPFLIGEQAEFELERNGRLFLGINDDDYSNNRDSFVVQIEIVPARR